LSLCDTHQAARWVSLRLNHPVGYSGMIDDSVKALFDMPGALQRLSVN
jgi:hypothetical protein